MLRRSIIILLMLASINLASAQMVKIKMEPSTLLPNDVADCKLILTTQQNTYISGISILSPPEIEVKPSSVSGIGYLPSTSYEFPFMIKAKESGIYTLTILINTMNGTIKQLFVVRVLNIMPDIVLDKTKIILNEVNDVSFTLSSPISINNVIVEPLFDANPKLIYVENGKGNFKFEPEDFKPLKFKIKFYNGKNYHEIVKTIDVEYVQSKGVLINASPEYPNTLIGDVDAVNTQITNLMEDTIYSVSVKANSSELSKIEEKHSLIDPKDSWKTQFLFCPKKGGRRDISFEVCYSDDLNRHYCEEKSVVINVLNETTIQFSGIETKIDVGGITLSGDVSNNGKSRMFNILITATSKNQTKSYYIDKLDPSDFDTFEFTFPQGVSFTLKSQWMNELGIKFEKIKRVDVRENLISIAKEKKTSFAYYLVLPTLTIILAIIYLAWKRRR